MSSIGDTDSEGSIKSAIALDDETIYNEEIDEDIDDFVVSYVEIVNKFVVKCIDGSPLKNTDFFLYTLMKGVKTLNMIFNTGLYYTRNHYVTEYLCEKGSYLYMKYLEHIYEDDKNLRMSCKDAVLFTYKETIYKLQKSLVCSKTEDFTGEYNSIINLVDNHSSIILKFLNNKRLLNTEVEEYTKYVYDNVTIHSNIMNQIISQSYIYNEKDKLISFYGVIYIEYLLYHFDTYSMSEIETKLMIFLNDKDMLAEIMSSLESLNDFSEKYREALYGGELDRFDNKKIIELLN